jgi:hypothetical protein
MAYLNLFPGFSTGPERLPNSKGIFTRLVLDDARDM